MKKGFTLFLLCIFCSMVSYAIDPIVGSTTTCVGWTASLSNATPGGTWSSSNPSIATISSSGLVSGIGVGTCTITYMAGSAYTTAPFTVNPANVITGPTSVCTGNTISLTGWPAGGSWTSGTPTVATVSSSGLVTGVGTGIVNIYYTGGGCYTYQIVNVSPSIPPLTGTTTVGTSFTTTLSSSVSGGVWTSSNIAIATVGSGSGVVTGVTAGSCNITYSVGGCYATALVTVTTSISPITGATNTCVGSTATVTATPSGGTWSTSNTAIATISSMGVVTGVAAGTVTITYTVGSVYVTRSFIVNTTPSISGSSTVCTGLTTMLTASPSGGTWSSSNPIIATVGSTGIVTGMSAGTATITYTFGTCSAYRTITVSSTASISGSSFACIGNTTPLTASPSGGTWSSSSTMIATVGSTGLVFGISSGTVIITYSAFGCIDYKTMTVNASPFVSGGTSVCVGATVPLSGSPSGGTWSSSNIMIATVGSTGVVTGTGGGLVTISYTRSGCSALYTVSVNSIPVITGPGSLCVGMNTTLGATPAGGSWTSGSPSVATVSPAGLVTAVSPGVVNIYYTASGCYAFKPITVNPAPASILGTTIIAPGGTSTLTCATPGGTWSSSNPLIASVGSSSGFVTGVAFGTCNITYSVGGCYVYVLFTVGTTSISPITGPSSTCVGSSITLTSSTCCGTWSSSHPSIATVSSLGIVTGISAGTCIITYTVGTLFVTYTFTVYSSATISGPTSICTGIPHTLTASIPGGTWSTADTAYASISSSGVLTGISAGTAAITYYAGGCYGYYTVIINAAPIITGSSSLCVGYTTMLTATPAGGTWTSGAPTVATVSSSGLVTGVSNGIVNIYYTQGSCYSFKAITVGTGAAITGSSTICIGTTTTLSATSAGGTWSSGSTWIATVGSTGIVTGLTSGVVNISYTLGGCSSYTTVTVNGSPVITGDMPMCTGSSIALTASVSGGTWSSSNMAVATVSPAGLVTGISSGTVNITYTTGSCYAYKTITVSTSATITGPDLVCIGSPSTFTGTPTGGTWSSSNTFRAIVNTMGLVTGLGGGAVNISYTTGSCYAYKTVTVTGAPFITGGGSPICAGDILSLSGSVSGGIWSSSNPAIATVSSSGTVTGVGAGIANITYTAGGCFTYTTVTVNSTPTISGGSIACIGVPLTLTGAPLGGTWTSSNTFRAIVNPSGIVTGLAGGTVNISYTLGSCYAYKTLTVTGAPTILGASTLCSGSAIVLTGSSSGGTWGTSNPSVATVTSSGTVIGVAGGTATITYNLGGCFSTKPITVNPTPTITGGTSVCIGTPLSLIGSPSSGVWASSNPSLASVNAFGQVTGISAGTVTITYTLNGCSTYHTLTIGVGAIISGSGPVCVGSTITLTSSLGGGTWTSSSTVIATVTSGNVTGVGAGVAIISYTMSSGCSATKPVTVNPNPAPITGPSSVRIGSSITLADASPGGTWVSTSPAIASVGPTTGIVTGLALGSSNIQYWWGGCAVNKTIIVTLFTSVGTPVSSTSATAAINTSSETRHMKPSDSNSSNPVISGDKIGSIKVFPNPSRGDLTIQWQNFEPGNFTMVITDVAGRKVGTSTISINEQSAQANVSLHELNEGVYFFNITDGHINYYGKLYIEK